MYMCIYIYIYIYQSYVSARGNTSRRGRDPLSWDSGFLRGVRRSAGKRAGKLAERPRPCPKKCGKTRGGARGAERGAKARGDPSPVHLSARLAAPRLLPCCCCFLGRDIGVGRPDFAHHKPGGLAQVLPAAVRCDMVSHRAFRARRVRTEKAASAARCDMVLHRGLRARHLYTCINTCISICV